MALKFRRGTTAQKSGSLAFGEPYVNTTEGALQVGLESGDITIRSVDSSSALVVTSVSASSFISASSLKVTGNATIDGNLTLGGNITIGDATTDTVTVTANLSSSLIPSVTNVFDLGSADKIWRDLYLSTGSIKLVNGSGTIVNTITNANIVTTDSIASGSVTLTNSLPAGTVSGSSQITLQSTTGFSAFDTALKTITGSLISSASTAKTTNDSQDVSITNLNTFSGSQLTQNTALATITGSLISSASSFETRNASLATITGSLISTASTNTQRLTAMEAVSGSWVTEAETSSFARTNTTNVFTTNQIISGGLDVTGTITANEFHTTYVSSSVMYNSGSNRFGDSADDLQQLIGIVEITGSIKGTQFDNLATITGSLITTASNHTQTLLGLSSATSSYARINQSNTFANSQIISGNVDVDGKITARFAVSASSVNINNANGNSQLELVNSTTGRGFHLISYDGDSFSIHNPTTGQSTFRIDSGSQYHSHFFGDVNILSGSVSSSMGFSGSINGIGNVTSYSTSVDSRITDLSGSTYSVSSSLDTRITNVSSSLDTLSGSTYSVSASLDTRISNVSSSLYDLSGSTYSISASLDTRIVNVSSSLNTLSGSTYSVSASLDTRVTNVSSSLYDLSGSTYSVSSSLDTRITNNSSSIASLNTYTASLNNAIQLTGSTVSFLGNIVVYGTQSVINSQNVSISDNIIYLSPTASIDNDLGIVGHYNDGTYRHAGIFMDASDGHSWKVFNGLTTETSAQIDTEGTGFTLADFKAGAFTGTSFNGQIIATNGVISGSSQIQLGSASGNIALATQTTGDYVASLVAGTNITLSNNSGENATPTIGLTNNAITIAGTSTSLGGSITAAKILEGTGVVSGSSQIDLTTTTNYASGILTRLNVVGVFSGSAQVSGLSNAQLSNSTISGKALGTNLDTLTIGTGLSGTSYNGSSAVTIANTGVTSLSAGTGVTLGATTGDCSISIGQSVATSATPTFAGLVINGAITATGDIIAYYTSDRRHKNNIQTIPNALQKVSKLNGVTWEWNDDVHEVTKSTPKTGLIAQEVQLVLPEVVTERADGFLALDYSKMMGLMVEAIKEQQIKIDNLTATVEELKRQRGL